MADPVGVSVSDLLLPPWTPDDVRALNRRQESRLQRPLTCPRHRRIALFATRWGWVCAARRCRYRQDWTHRVDAETW